MYYISIKYILLDFMIVITYAKSISREEMYTVVSCLKISILLLFTGRLLLLLLLVSLLETCRSARPLVPPQFFIPPTPLLLLLYEKKIPWRQRYLFTENSREDRQHCALTVRNSRPFSLFVLRITDSYSCVYLEFVCE